MDASSKTTSNSIATASTSTVSSGDADCITGLCCRLRSTLWIVAVSSGGNPKLLPSGSVMAPDCSWLRESSRLTPPRPPAAPPLPSGAVPPRASCSNSLSMSPALSLGPAEAVRVLFVSGRFFAPILRSGRILWSIRWWLMDW